MLYCSKVCQKKDWARKGKEEPHSHKKWCAKMKQYMQKTEILREFPFTYAQGLLFFNISVKMKNSLDTQKIVVIILKFDP